MPLTDMDTLPFLLFNEKVARLQACRLAKRMQNPNYQIQYEKIMNREWIAADDITPDDVDAFVLNLRLLVQDNDGFSIRCLADEYRANSVPQRLQDRFAEVREELHTHFNSRSVIGKPGDQGNYSNKELFDIIMYGGLSHNDKKYLQEFRFLTQSGLFSALVFASFLQTVGTILEVAKRIGELNDELLKTLRESTTPHSQK